MSPERGGKLSVPLRTQEAGNIANQAAPNSTEVHTENTGSGGRGKDNKGQQEGILNQILRFFFSDKTFGQIHTIPLFPADFRCHFDCQHKVVRLPLQACQIPGSSISYNPIGRRRLSEDCTDLLVPQAGQEERDYWYQFGVIGMHCQD